MKYLFAPMRLRANQEGDQRHATWLESFYDLVFAVALTALVSSLRDDPTPGGLARFVILFLPIWWAWVGQTVYLTRFDTDDLSHRLMMFGQMLAAAIMATQVSRVFTTGADVFVVAYLAVRYSLLFMYVRARFAVPGARRLTNVYLIGFGIGAVLWTLSLFVTPPAQYVLWVIGLGIEFAAPWLGQRILRRTPVDVSHLPERFAQFNLIVLGETLFEAINSLAQVQWTATTILAAMLVFTIAVLIAGRYFIYTDREKSTIQKTLGPGQQQIYSHLPFVLGLTIIGASAAHLVAESTQRLYKLSTLALITGGDALCVVAGLLIYVATTRHTPEHGILLNVRTLSLYALLGIGVLGVWLPPLVILAALLAITLASLSVMAQRTGA